MWDRLRDIGPWPLAGAGVAGALLALLMVWLFPPATERSDPSSALVARLAAMEKRLTELANRPAPAPPPSIDPQKLDALAGRLDKLEKTLAAPRPPLRDTELANQMAMLAGEVKALAEMVSRFNQRSDDIASIARDARRRADANAAALAELSQKIARPGPPPATRSDVEAIAGRLDAMEKRSAAIELELAKRTAAGTDKSVRLVIAAAALKTAVDRGDAYVSELAAAKLLAADQGALAALEPLARTGVPSAAALSRQLLELLPGMRMGASGTRRDGSFLERLQSNAERLVRIRPVGEVKGDEPAMILARIELHAEKSNIDRALGELEKLPAAVRAPADAWIAQARARAAALDASQKLAAAALAALGQ
jgi:hypothetical protein